jgi:hypothetical protein
MGEPSLPPIRLPFASRRISCVYFCSCCFSPSFSLWFSSRALLRANFLRHWYCLAGNTRLLWTTVLGDLFIGVSYVAISATLVRIIRRAGPGLPYQGFLWAFGLFIISCGVTHFIEILTIWQPVYWFAAPAKILTAVSSVGTAVVLAVAVEDIISFVRTARQAATGPCKANPIVPPEYLVEHKTLLKSTLVGSVTIANQPRIPCNLLPKMPSSIFRISTISLARSSSLAAP